MSLESGAGWVGQCGLQGLFIMVDRILIGRKIALVTHTSHSEICSLMDSTLSHVTSLAGAYFDFVLCCAPHISTAGKNAVSLPLSKALAYWVHTC